MCCRSMPALLLTPLSKGPGCQPSFLKKIHTCSCRWQCGRLASTRRQTWHTAEHPRAWCMSAPSSHPQTLKAWAHLPLCGSRVNCLQPVAGHVCSLFFSAVLFFISQCFSLTINQTTVISAMTFQTSEQPCPKLLLQLMVVYWKEWLHIKSCCACLT